MLVAGLHQCHTTVSTLGCAACLVHLFVLGLRGFTVTIIVASSHNDVMTFLGAIGQTVRRSC